MRELILDSAEYGTQSWTKTLLGNIIQITKKPKEVRYTSHTSLPFVPMENIPIGRMFFNKFELRESEQVSSGTYFESGDILLAKITPSFENGKQGIIQSLPMRFGVATTEVIPIQEVKGVSDKHFLFYILLKKDVRSNLASKMEGSTGRQRLSVSTLANQEVNLPPLPEQRAIAQVLQSVQNVIQVRRNELELEREYKAVLMQHLFSCGVQGKPTKQTEIGEVPENWSIVKLGQLCQSSAFGPRFSSTCYDANGNIATLRTTDLDDDGNINYETMPFAQLDTDAFKEHFLQAGDLLITRSGTCGIASVFTGFSKPVLPGAFLIRFRLLAQIDPVFLKYYLNSSLGRKRVLQLATGAIQKNLTSTSLRMLDVILPSYSEQAEIVNILQMCDSKITAIAKEITLYEELFLALLDELMTGKLSALPLVE